MTDPLVSVIIPVRNRRAMLRQTLDALAAQTFAPFEVVVVDDGSTDGSDGEAAEAGARGLAVRLVRSPGRGAVAARIAGVGASRGRYLAFTDSDCVPAPDWLEQGVRALTGGADVVQGATRPHGPCRALQRSMWVLAEDGLYATCNVFYRRAAYEAAGGFDPGAGRRLGFRPGSMLRGLGFGEDALLGWRVRRCGRAAFAADAVVEHQVFDVDVADAARRAWATGAFPSLVREIPELRRYLADGIFLGRRSRLPLYLALAAASTGRRRLATLALSAWFAGRSAHVWRIEPSRRRRAKVLPVDLLLDATTAAALLAGSARSGTVVL